MSSINNEITSFNLTKGNDYNFNIKLMEIFNLDLCIMCLTTRKKSKGEINIIFFIYFKGGHCIFIYKIFLFYINYVQESFPYTHIRSSYFAQNSALKYNVDLLYYFHRYFMSLTSQ